MPSKVFVSDITTRIHGLKLLMESLGLCLGPRTSERALRILFLQPSLWLRDSSTHAIATTESLLYARCLIPALTISSNWGATRRDLLWSSTVWVLSCINSWRAIWSKVAKGNSNKLRWHAVWKKSNTSEESRMAPTSQQPQLCIALSLTFHNSKNRSINIFYRLVFYRLVFVL